MTLDGVAVAILAFVTLQRLGELILAQRNTERLLAQGAHEVAPGHYPLIVGLHAAWLIGLWLLSAGREASLPLLAIFALLQAGRLWVLATLGGRWTSGPSCWPRRELGSCLRRRRAQRWAIPSFHSTSAST